MTFLSMMEGVYLEHWPMAIILVITMRRRSGRSKKEADKLRSKVNNFFVEKKYYKGMVLLISLLKHSPTNRSWLRWSINMNKLMG